MSKLKPFFAGRALPDSHLCEHFGHALLRGDKPMDELLDWMLEVGLKKSKPQFQQALEQGIQSLSDPSKPLQAFFALVDQVPQWVDFERVNRGGDAFAMMGRDLSVGLRDFILMGGYLSSSINEVLALSGGLQKGPVRRLAETADWYMQISETDGLQRFSAGFKSTMQVRWVHALVRRRIREKPDWSSHEHGLPVNQTDMAATWLGASIGGAIGAMLLGRLVLSPQDLRDYLHMHKYAHWLMGVEEEILSDDPAECAHRLANNTWTQPGASEVCRVMAKALADYGLQQEYPRPSGLRQRWHRHSQLSRSRYFLGRGSMRELGLSTQVLPWYPLLALPPKAIASVVQRFVLPGQRQRLIRQGREQQRAFMNGLYGSGIHKLEPQALSALG
ncbi:MAG: oxygenase MpaB family protein [Oceanococcus sp.]